MKYDFESKRLGFRRWKDEDKHIFSKMNSDKEVMEFMPKLLNIGESNDFIARIEAHFEKCGFGLWAVEIKERNEFIGFIGFLEATFESDFTPCIEIGWRLSKTSWNRGYATEGAKACLDYGFKVFNLNEVYSFTSSKNMKSIKVMEKIGLEKVKDFMHPNLEEGNPLRPHVLYCIHR